jgi:hypothetical protein
MIAIFYLKLVAVPFAAGLAATGLGFLFLWPKSGREAAARFACTLLACAVAGPCLAIAAYCWWPALFDSSGQFAILAGGPAELGVLLAAAPFLVVRAPPQQGHCRDRARCRRSSTACARNIVRRILRYANQDSSSHHIQADSSI